MSRTTQVCKVIVALINFKIIPTLSKFTQNVFYNNCKQTTEE